MHFRQAQKIRTYIAISLPLAGICFLFGCGGGGNVSLPADAKPICTFTSGEFSAMFASGSVTRDGVVKPANSLDFGGIENCQFYQWAEQMFLWVTSPAPANYGGGGGRIFESPVFFDVTPPDANNQRTLIRHAPGNSIFMSVRDLQAGIHGLPIINSKAGKILEVVQPVLSKSGRQLILGNKGDTLEIARAVMGAKQVPVLYDGRDNLIEGPRPIIPPAFRGQDVVQAIKVNGFGNIFINSSGTVIEVEQGQADNAVLETQSGSLIYYSIMVNDVFAYYLTGQKDGVFNQIPANFPTSLSELSQIAAFAKAHGVPKLPDSSALAVELKASWVEADGLADPQNYIKLVGTIPTYNKSDPMHWIATGTKQATLALVGIHVVGTVAGHPEMIWTTFEHNENTPNADYAYINMNDVVVNVPKNTSGNWLFCADGADIPFNQPHMSLAAPDILSNPGPPAVSISPSNTIRWKAWGTGSDQGANPDDPSASYANTKIISINNSVHGLLASGDIRANYDFRGAVWSFEGGSPLGNAGTVKLCNTTMETYQQGSNTLIATGASCFSCHSLPGPDISHIYSITNPLF